MSRIVVALLWLLHWLPLSLQAPIGRAIGLLLYVIIAPRRRVVHTNLRLCFPELPEAERRALAREHFALAGRSLVERGLAWFAPAERIRRLVRIEGEDRLRQLVEARQPVILLTPHFLGLDLGGTRMAISFDCVSIYARQKDKVIDRWLFHGRSRFGSQVLLRRDESVRASIKAMKEIRPFYYLPDMDNGPEDSIFVPFFGGAGGHPVGAAAARQAGRRGGWWCPASPACCRAARATWWSWASRGPTSRAAASKPTPAG